MIEAIQMFVRLHRVMRPHLYSEFLCSCLFTYLCVCDSPKICFLKEDLSDNEEMFPKEITKWSSNDLMDKIESPECDDVQGNFFFNV